MARTTRRRGQQETAPSHPILPGDRGVMNVDDTNDVGGGRGDAVGVIQDEKGDHIKSTLAALPFNVLFQVSSRILTFVMNGHLLRSVSPAALGVMNVRLLLIYSSTQFMSREPFRKALSSPSQVSFALLSVPLGLFYGMIFFLTWTRWLVTPIDLEGYALSSFLMVSAVLIELIAEPLFLLAQSQCKFHLRIIAEGTSLLIRCLSLCLFVWYVKDDRSREKHILPTFAFGQLIGSIVYTIIFILYFRRHIGRLFREFVILIRQSPHLLSLTWSFMKQTVIKQLLTEGEKFVMTFFNPLSFAEQGVYDVINNLASLAARLIFAPLEESSFIMFSSLVDRRKEGKEHSPQQIKKSWSLLSFLIKSMAIVGLVIFTFGYNLSHAALLIYAGRTFTETTIAPTLLRWQVLYILIISLNGVSEAFTTAAMNQDQLNYFNRILAFLSLVLMGSSLVLTKIIGSVGLIVANSINMSGRIVHSLLFIKKFYGSSFIIWSLIPGGQSLLIIMSTFLLLRASEVIFCCLTWSSLIIHVVISGILFLILGLALYFCENELFKNEHFSHLYARFIPMKKNE